MPRPRRFHLFPLDARVLSVGGELHRTGHDECYGLEVARILLEERSDREPSFHRLSPFGRESLVFARAGARVFGRR